MIAPALAGIVATVILIPACWYAWRRTRRATPIDDLESVADAMDAALPGFVTIGAVLGTDRLAALAVASDGRVAVAWQRGKRPMLCEVSWRQVRAATGAVIVEIPRPPSSCVFLAGVSAVDVRRIVRPAPRG